MNRRQFLHYSAAWDASLSVEGIFSSCAQVPIKPADKALFQDLRIIDAHAHPATLKQAAEMSQKPLLDSHTSPCPGEDPSRCHRFRTWKDMEMVVKTGGLVCTWPFAYKPGNSIRKTFLD